MKKLILVAFAMIILAVILPQDVDVKGGWTARTLYAKRNSSDSNNIEQANDPIVVRETGLIQWWWLLVGQFFSALILFFQFICGNLKIGSLQSEIGNLYLNIEKKDKALKKAEKCLKTIQENQYNEIKNEFAHLTSENIVEHLPEAEWDEFFKWIINNCPVAMLDKFDKDFLRTYLKVDEEKEDYILELIADKVLKRR